MTPRKESAPINFTAAACLILTVAALIAIIPGLTQPMFSVDVTGTLSSQFGKMSTPILDQTRSILGTIAELFAQERWIPAVAILVFSVVFPIIKGIMVIFSLLTPDGALRETLYKIIGVIGKWSMADVFVVAIFLCYLSTTGDSQRQMHTIKVFGMVIPIEVMTRVTSEVGVGFWCFLGYCLLSLIAVTIWQPHRGLYLSTGAETSAKKAP